ncbi:hypothetical protein PSEUDO9AG_70338 [Pseudomonas sp. 9Ag]|nr:hypothetical protein PSEUDO9AG_70338 [Pseudomonas sp. 9Ag]
MLGRYLLSPPGTGCPAAWSDWSSGSTECIAQAIRRGDAHLPLSVPCHLNGEPLPTFHPISLHFLQWASPQISLMFRALSRLWQLPVEAIIDSLSTCGNDSTILLCET